MKIFQALLGVFVLVWAQLSYADTKTQVLDLPTRPGVTVRILALTPAQPKAAVILLAGGHGGLRISPEGTMRWGEGNFLIRTRSLFADQGLTAVVVDTPTDRMSPPFLSGFRHTNEHALDLKTVIGWLRQQANIPVWLVGTSRGTESAAAAGIHLQGTDGLRGLVLTSSILVNSRSVTVPQMPLNTFQGPVLVVHHELDACRVTLFSDLDKLKVALNPNAVHEVMVFQGGVTRGDPCEAMAYHGYNGIEPEVVRKISEWVVSH
jgi:hypothetical protein